MLSPKKAPPIDTPYSPPIMVSSRHTSMLWARPRANRAWYRDWIECDIHVEARSEAASAHSSMIRVKAVSTRTV